MIEIKTTCPRVLIAVKSCHTHRFAHAPIVSTWGSRVVDYPNLDLRFFVGGDRLESLTENEVWVDCLDDYGHLVDKMRRIVTWILTAKTTYDYLFVSDTDTFVDVPKLMTAVPEDQDYVGYTGMNYVHGAPHGGPGYWLSRRALYLLSAYSGPPLAEKLDEWWVYRVLKHFQVPPTHDDRYSLLTLPGKSHDCITYHDKRLRDDPAFLSSCFSATL